MAGTPHTEVPRVTIAARAECERRTIWRLFANGRRRDALPRRRALDRLHRVNESTIFSQMAIQYTDALDRTFHALGDGSRRRMLATISQKGTCSAGELGA